MRLDSITISSVITELNNIIIPAKIIDIYQIGKFELILLLKNNHHVRQLFFSIRPDRMTFFLSHFNLPEKSFSASFYQYLKHWIVGSTIIEIKQFQFDRIITVKILPYIKFGPLKYFYLKIEFMGKHSNIILLDDRNQIKATIKQVDSEVNRYREIKPGLQYIPPPTQNKINPLTTNQANFIQRLKENHQKDLYFWQHLSGSFQGIGIKSAKEITTLCGLSNDEKLGQLPIEHFNKIAFQFIYIMQNIKLNKISPKVILDKNKGNVIDYTLIGPKHTFQNTSQIISFDQTSDCLEYVYKKLTERDKIANLNQLISKHINKNLKKLQSKISFLQKRNQEIRNSSYYKIKGELIKANLWKIKNGDNRINLIDFTQPDLPEVMVELKPDLSPQENAQYYFKKYKKLSQNTDLIKTQLDYNLKALHKLQQLKNDFNENRESLAVLSKLVQDLIRLKYIQKNKKSFNKKKGGISAKTNSFFSSDGWTILLGKNDKQNENILKYLSSGNDFWLHNRSRPGSHVLIKNHKNVNTPPFTTLQFAAKLAIYFSKTKNNEKAEVIYTMRKYVKKPKNAKPGKVIYTNEKTIVLKNNKEDIQKKIALLQVH